MHYSKTKPWRTLHHWIQAREMGILCAAYQYLPDSPVSNWIPGIILPQQPAHKSGSWFILRVNSKERELKLPALKWNMALNFTNGLQPYLLPGSQFIIYARQRKGFIIIYLCKISINHNWKYTYLPIYVYNIHTYSLLDFLLTIACLESIISNVID